VADRPFIVHAGWLKGRDPLVTVQQLDTLGMELREFEKPLIATSRVMADDVKENFDTESSPDGTAWQQWSEKYGYVARARGQTKLLQWTGDLYDSATKISSYTIESTRLGEGSVSIDPNKLPDYWVYHDQPDKPNLTGETGKSKSPQRKFLAISDRAKRAIDTIFDEWFDGTLRGVSRATGQPLRMIPGIGVRFGHYYY